MIDRATKRRWEQEDAERLHEARGEDAPRGAAGSWSLPPCPPFGDAQVGGLPSPGSPAKPSDQALLAFRMGMELGAHIERTGGLH